MENKRVDFLVHMLTAVSICPDEPERRFLLDTGWIPLGKRAFTDIEGWGKMIDERAVIVDQPEALAMAGWKGNVDGR